MATLLTIDQVAAIMNEPYRTVRWWCLHGHLPARKVGRDWVIDQADLASFVRPKSGNPRPHLNGSEALKKVKVKASEKRRAVPARQKGKRATCR